MELKHTPGPWEVGDFIHNVTHQRDLAVWKGYEEAICLISPKEDETEQDLANAKLIAAAPELLEALIELKKWVGRLEDWRGIDPPCEIVDEAINKATL